MVWGAMVKDASGEAGNRDVMVARRHVNRYRAMVGAALALCAVASRASADPTTRPATFRPDTFLSRVSALAEMETLNADLLAARSATRVLEAWCADHAMAADPRLKAQRVPGPDKPLDAAGRARLAIGPDEPVRYRHVKLACGTHVLSDADNWYVPARLTPAMNEALDTTDTSFGTVVAPLGVTRETLSARTLWQALPPGWDMRAPAADRPERPLDVPPVLFEHRAALYDAHHTPVSEVAEHYTNEILAFAPAR